MNAVQRIVDIKTRNRTFLINLATLLIQFEINVNLFFLGNNNMQHFYVAHGIMSVKYKNRIPLF